MSLQSWGKTYDLPAHVPMEEAVSVVFKLHHLFQFWTPVEVRLNPKEFGGNIPAELQGIPVLADQTVVAGKVRFIQKFDRVM